MSGRGKAWEAQLERLHDRYRRDQLAAIWRVHPGVRVHQDRGSSFVGSWIASGPPDFTGVLWPQGRGVLFDAKDCEGDRWPLASLERHQARDLEAAHLAGGLAFVALQLDGRAYVLPWADLGPRFWAWYERTGRAAVGTASIAPAAWWRAFDVAGAGWLAAFTLDELQGAPVLA